MITNNFITSRMQGRTGNMMFQIAFGYVKALEYNRQFVVPKYESSSLHLEKTLFRKLDFNIDRWDDIPNTKPRHQFRENELIPYDDCPTAFHGWYQSEKFFGKYTEVIKDLYSPTKEFEAQAIIDFPFIKDSEVLAINVRRGDYLNFPLRHPVVTLEYIYEAIKHVPNYDMILVVSDDIEWCKENIKLPNVVFDDKYRDCESMWLLSMCSHFIISNSTFTWWGAYLSRNPNKIVVAPATWYGPEITYDPKDEDVYSKGWIKIPTYWDNGFIRFKE